MSKMVLGLFLGHQDSKTMSSPEHRTPRGGEVLVETKSSDGGKIEFICFNSRIVVCGEVRVEKLYGVRYKGVIVFPPDSFEMANSYLWNEFLDP